MGCGAPINRKISVFGVGTSEWVPLNRWTDSDISLLVSVGGTATYTVETTLDRVNRQGTIPVPIDHATLVGQTVGNTGNVAFPVEAVRVSVTSGTGSVTMHVMQNGG